MKSENKLLNNFLLALKSKGRSQNTINGYEIDNIQLLNYIRDKRNLTASIDTFDKEFFNSIEYQDLEFYMNYLTGKKEPDSESTRARKTTSIREFFKYMKKIKAIDDNVALEMETPKIPKRNPKFLSLQESKNMIKAVDGRNEERDFAIVTLLFNLGLRVSELVSIDITDIKEGMLRVIRKGNEEKFLPLNEHCINAINAYLLVRPETSEKALFLSERKKRESAKTVRYMTNKYGNVSPHTCRHSCATNLLNTGVVNLKQIQELLNHKNIGTTSRYVHITESEMRATVNANPYY